MSDELVTAVDSGPSDDDVVDLLDLVADTCHNVLGWKDVALTAGQDKDARTITVTIHYAFGDET